MKRIHRARKVALAAALAIGTGLASTLGVASATAVTPAASFNLSNGSSNISVDQINGVGLVGAALGLIKATDGIVNYGVVPTIEHTEDSIRIVLDPSVIPGLADAFAPANPTQLTTTEGQRPDGTRVVFPTSGTLTSTFGQRWGAMHEGIDVANPIGTPIVSVMDGTVISAGPAQGFGNWVRVQHDDGSISVYGHMQASSILVQVGQRVSAGEQIAAIGNEGQSTGPHLHFEIRPDGVNPTDPQAWFAQAGITV